MGDYKKEIIPLRDEIDSIDKELLGLFAKRFGFVEKVGDLKKKYGVDPLDMNRWNDLMIKKKEMGEELGLSKEFIENIWNIMHDEALKIEKK